MGRNVRQHVNPLGLHYQRSRARALQIPDAYQDAPLEVELGCADGDFSFELAARCPERFVVGLEIREAMVERNLSRLAREGLSNLTFAYVNMNVDLDRVFSPNRVHRFHLLYPDPWFKARHQKRRVMERDLLDCLAAQLECGGELHFASDVFDLGLDALSELESAHTLGFRNLCGPWTFARDYPWPAQSRRERTTLRRQQRVWRLRFAYEGPGASSSSVGSGKASGNSAQFP